MTPHVRVFLELGASRTESDLNRTTLLSFFNLSATDPANPFRQAIRVQTPVLDFPQTGVTRTETFRGLSGAIVDLSHDWRAEVDYAFDRANLRETLAATSFANAAASGAVSSGSVNVFQDINIYTTNLSTYVLPAITVNPTHSIQNDVTLRVAGPVGALPAGPIAVSVLTEYRKQEYSRYSTTDYSSGTASTSVYTPQSVAVRSAYVEGRFPLISKINALSWAESLEAQLAARYDDYHQIGGGFISAPAIDLPGAPNDLSSFDPTVGIRFQPMEDAAFRVSYGTGFTTPSLVCASAKACV
ncbi:MAG: TonB-dependent receptor [Gammaproteobacteria bacterium]